MDRGCAFWWPSPRLVLPTCLYLAITELCRIHAHAPQQQPPQTQPAPGRPQGQGLHQHQKLPGSAGAAAEPIPGAPPALHQHSSLGHSQPGWQHVVRGVRQPFEDAGLPLLMVSGRGHQGLSAGVSCTQQPEPGACHSHLPPWPASEGRSGQPGSRMAVQDFAHVRQHSQSLPMQRSAERGYSAPQC